MNRLLALIILMFMSLSASADEYWNDFACMGKCDKSIKFITSHKPNYSGNIGLDIDVAYRNIRQGLYECFSIDAVNSVNIISEYYNDIKTAEIHVVAGTWGGSGHVQTEIYIQIKSDSDNSSYIDAWGNKGYGHWQYPAKNIREIASAGIDVDCKKIFEFEERKEEHDNLFKRPL